MHLKSYKISQSNRQHAPIQERGPVNSLRQHEKTVPKAVTESNGSLRQQEKTELKAVTENNDFGRRQHVYGLTNFSDRLRICLVDIWAHTVGNDQMEKNTAGSKHSSSKPTDR